MHIAHRNGVYRSAFASIAGLILLGAAPQPASNTKPPKSDRNAELAESLKKFARPQREAVVGGKQSRPCEPGEDNRNSDLCAQWKSADAASDAAFWAMFSALITIAGTLGVLWTLRESRRTADAAIEGVKEARKAAKAAVDQQRAWIKILEIAPSHLSLDLPIFGQGKPDQISFCARATIKNIGSTPALAVRWHTAIWLMENAISSDGKWCGVRDEIIEKVVSRYSSGGNFSDAPEGGEVLFPDDKTQEDHWSTTLDWDFEDIIQVDRKSEQVLGIFGMVLIVYRLTNGEVAYTARAFRMIFKDGPPTIMELMHRPIRLGGDIKINMLRDGVRAT